MIEMPRICGLRAILSAVRTATADSVVRALALPLGAFGRSGVAVGAVVVVVVVMRRLPPVRLRSRLRRRTRRGGRSARGTRRPAWAGAERRRPGPRAVRTAVGPGRA